MQAVRSTTPPHRTEVKDAFAELREALDPEARMLLVRVGRDLEWDEIARILDQRGPALRKGLKKRLRELAREREIVPVGGDAAARTGDPDVLELASQLTRVCAVFRSRSHVQPEEPKSLRERFGADGRV